MPPISVMRSRRNASADPRTTPAPESAPTVLRLNPTALRITAYLNPLGSPAAGSLAWQVGLATGLSLAGLLCGFLLSLTIGRKLGPDSLGIFHYAMAWATLLTTISNMGFATLAVREFAVFSNEGQTSLLRGFLRFSSAFTLTLSLVIAALVVLFAAPIASATDPRYGPALLFIAGAVPLLALSRLYQQSLRGLDHVLLSQYPDAVMRPLLLLVLIAVTLLLGAAPSTTALLAMQAGVLSSVTVFSWWLLRRHLPSLSAPPSYHVGPWSAAGARFAAIDLVQTLSHRSDLLLIGFFLDPVLVGVYAVTQQLANLVNLPLMAGNLVLAPQVARAFRATGPGPTLDQLVGTGTGLVFLAGIPLILILLLLDRLILGVWGEQFTLGTTALAILVAGQSINLFFANNALVLNMVGREHRSLQVTALAAALALILNALLIPTYGIVGAAIANATTAAIWNLLLARDVLVLVGIDPTPFSLLHRLTGRRTGASLGKLP